jgi:AbrB family looped-hinge helix DNA binding protein
MRITGSGRVTIPKRVRDATGLLPNTEVDITVEHGRAVLRPVAGADSRGARIVNHLKKHGAKMRLSSRQLLSLLRDDP